MRYVLDTDHVIYYLNNDSAVVRAIQSRKKQTIAITRFTHAELLFGAYRSSRPAQNLGRVHVFIKEVRMLEFTDKAAHLFASIKTEQAREGKPCPVFDLLIGSVVMAHHGVLITNNTKDFKNIDGLRLENWTEKY